MGPVDIYNFVKELITKWDADKVAALVTGMILCLTFLLPVLWMVRRWLVGPRESSSERAERGDAWKGKWSEEQGKAAVLAQALQHKQDETASQQEKIKALSQECESLKESDVALAERVKLLTSDRQRLIKKANGLIGQYFRQVKDLTRQIAWVESQDGRFWEQAVSPGAPKFRPLGPQSAPIISVVNLKGGVGKTTLTANIGAMLWEQGYRVLLADLDHQGSLTSLCLSPEQQKDVRLAGGKYVQHVLAAQDHYAETVWKNLTRVGDKEGFLLPADEDLADVEERIKAHWLLHSNGRDVRYLLRAGLHDPLIQQRFDIILLDCPPRWTTASINALTCSDYVLVPVLLDKTSTLAVPRLLAWLRNFKSKICPDLSLLGVVANRTATLKKLLSREKDVWQELQARCQDTWKEPVYFFERFLPGKVNFGRAAEKHTFAAFDPAVHAIFQDLVNELKKRKVLHESRRPAAVSQ